MMLKTFAILLSLGTAYSTASYAMASKEELETARENGRKAFQRLLTEPAGIKEAHLELGNKLKAEDQKLRDAALKNINALDDSTSDEERALMVREFEELSQNVRATKQALLAEFNKQFGNN